MWPILEHPLTIHVRDKVATTKCKNKFRDAFLLWYNTGQVWSIAFLCVGFAMLVLFYHWFSATITTTTMGCCNELMLPVLFSFGCDGLMEWAQMCCFFRTWFCFELVFDRLINIFIALVLLVGVSPTRIKPRALFY